VEKQFFYHPVANYLPSMHGRNQKVKKQGERVIKYQLCAQRQWHVIWQDIFQVTQMKIKRWWVTSLSSSGMKNDGETPRFSFKWATWGNVADNTVNWAGAGTGTCYIDIHTFHGLPAWDGTNTHTQHTTILWLYGFCPGQPGWASTIVHGLGRVTVYPPHLNFFGIFLYVWV